jgi:hypothetical protein
MKLQKYCSLPVVIQLIDTNLKTMIHVYIYKFLLHAAIHGKPVQLCDYWRYRKTIG